MLRNLRHAANNIVFVDAEIPGGCVWWMENVDGKGHFWFTWAAFHPETRIWTSP